MASYRFKFRAFLLSFLFLLIIFVISAFQILYKTSQEYDDADDYIFQEEDQKYEDNNRDVEVDMEKHQNILERKFEREPDSFGDLEDLNKQSDIEAESDIEEKSDTEEKLDTEKLEKEEPQVMKEAGDVDIEEARDIKEAEDVKEQSDEEEEAKELRDSEEPTDVKQGLDFQEVDEFRESEDLKEIENVNNKSDQQKIDIQIPVEEAQNREKEQHKDSLEALKEGIQQPIIMWWYGFSHEQGKVKKCGDVSCFFTNDRHYFNHSMMTVFAMYGTSFDPLDLPFPRKPQHEWALMHEESPKNVYLFSHPEMMELYNLTATFKRESHFPLTTLWLNGLENIETKKYLLPVGEKTRHREESGLALAAYIHSDCGCPSDRDHFVDIMQKYIKVDSYGKCKHNKDLPANLTDALRSMEKPEFYRILAKYKFIITAENGVCDDYITEKFWRTFEVGSVPIFIGSKKIRDFLPDNHSAIIVDDYKRMKDLVDLMQYLDQNDDEYEKYLAYKTTGVTNKYLLEVIKSRVWGDFPGRHHSFVTATECFLCKKIHENIHRKNQGLQPFPHRATVEHYGCPRPLKFSGVSPNDLQRVEDDWHATEWLTTKWQAKALKQMWSEGKYNFSQQQLHERASIFRNGAQL